ncbi:MAG: hypothetical protein IJY87_00970 [Bacilli bacterium]|nr:hypothetical protein [Bacilli bacterium]
MECNVFYRMIFKPFWPCEESIDSLDECLNNLELRTIIKDFRTKDNTLSIWNLDDPKDVVLALINPNYRLEDAFFVKITKEELEANGLILNNNKGNSIFEELNENHYDIVDVNYKTLGKVSKLILSALKNGDCELVTTHEIIKIIRKLVDEEKINVAKLPKEIKEKIAGQ